MRNFISTVFLTVGIICLFLVLCIDDMTNGGWKLALALVVGSAISFITSAVVYYPGMVLRILAGFGCVVGAAAFRWIPTSFNRRCKDLRSECDSNLEFFKECEKAYDRYVDYIQPAWYMEVKE